eukprot:1144698-Pelagomonas_calceolata.AAC.2
MGSIGGLAGSGWATTSGGGAVPVSYFSRFFKYSILFTIIRLVETRTKKLYRMMHYLPGYAVHNINITDVYEGKKGHGIAVLAAPSCADHVRFLRLSEHLQSIWFKSDECMFGLDEDVVLGASYINPQSTDFSAKSIENHYTDLFEDVLDALQVVAAAAASSMAIITGRVAGDSGQPSYVGHHKDRPDHVLL